MAKVLDKPTRLITGEVRICYPHVFTPYAGEQGGEEKYSVCILIPKADKETLTLVRAAIEAAKQEGKAKFGGVIPAKFKNETLRDGDEELAMGTRTGEEYEGHYFINASARKRPMVIDRSKQPITDEEQVYGGCYGHVQLTFFAYNSNGNKGVAAGLDALMKTREGDPLGGNAVSIANFDGFGDAEDLGF